MVRQAWTKLDQRQAHIIHRWYVEGWSADEIAAETRLAVNHIYVLKHRGLKKLREYMRRANSAASPVLHPRPGGRHASAMIGPSPVHANRCDRLFGPGALIIGAAGAPQNACLRGAGQIINHQPRISRIHHHLQVSVGVKVCQRRRG